MDPSAWEGQGPDAVKNEEWASLTRLGLRPAATRGVTAGWKFSWQRLGSLEACSVARQGSCVSAGRLLTVRHVRL